ncbi:hypothetical protein F2Q68_00009506 [Brassica cretica]|uniref:Uncharacterized protein n=1 Tax=Brassica cretica TaxID=69181 RepID=A0A8S9KPB7_BRACR|nr:hypothetical protein F2Q68_00009506 [Brassica cretica]
MDSVMNLMKEVELEEKDVEMSVLETVRGGLDTLEKGRGHNGESSPRIKASSARSRAKLQALRVSYGSWSGR